MALNPYFSEDDITSYTSGRDEEVEGVLKTNLAGIFGIPYQFLPTVDPRIPGTELGRKYTEKIISRMPLLFLTPCRQVFMADFSQSDKEKVLSSLLGGNSAGIDSINGSGKYYTTEFDYATYYEYVNTMCRQVAFFLGIADERVGIDGNKKIKDINWANAVNSSFKNYFAASSAVVSYVDGLTSMSDSFSNSTTESSLSSTINGFSDQANEVKFLLGSNSALRQMMNTSNDVISNITSSLSGITDLAGGMLSDLASTGVSTILHGGKIIFPKIWQDSSFSRSYSFDIKLRSPDHDTLSIYLSVLVPYLHYLGLVLPKAMEDDPNGYMTPFLVKAYCKGMFNIDMGIITDLSATKGAECCWNDDGLPTQIDLSFSIEDLYSSLFMSKYSDLVSVVKNTSMMDFLSNLSGLNVADQEFGRRAKMIAYLTGSYAATTGSRMWSKFDTKVSNVVKNLYNKF